MAGVQVRPLLLDPSVKADHRARSSSLAITENGSITRTEQPFVAIPYSTWANRGGGQMAVWLARTDAAAKPTPFPTVATTSTVTAALPPAGRGVE